MSGYKKPRNKKNPFAIQRCCSVCVFNCKSLLFFNCQILPELSVGRKQICCIRRLLFHSHSSDHSDSFNGKVKMLAYQSSLYSNGWN